MIDLGTLESVLICLKELIGNHSSSAFSLSTSSESTLSLVLLSEPDGTLDQCKKSLQELLKISEIPLQLFKNSWVTLFKNTSIYPLRKAANIIIWSFERKGNRCHAEKHREAEVALCSWSESGQHVVPPVNSSEPHLSYGDESSKGEGQDSGRQLASSLEF
jgi:hypothetical protein